MFAIATNPDARALLDTDGDLATLRQLAKPRVELDVRSAESHELRVPLSGSPSCHELARPHAALRRPVRARGAPPPGRSGAARAVVPRPRSHHQPARRQVPHREEREERSRDALGSARTAQTLLKNTERPENADRSRAMEGLLLQKLADFPARSEQTLALLRAAREVIEEGARPSQQPPERTGSGARAQRVQSRGIRMRLAREEVNLASDHLQSASKVNGSVGRLRRAIYARQQPTSPHA